MFFTKKTFIPDKRKLRDKLLISNESHKDACKMRLDAGDKNWTPCFSLDIPVGKVGKN